VFVPIRKLKTAIEEF